MIGFARLRQRLAALFPERHLYVRSGGEMHGFVLSSRKQMLAAGGVAAAALWMGVSTASMLIGVAQSAAANHQIAQGPLKASRAQLDGAGAPLSALASTVEKRHAALALLLADARTAPGAAQALTPAIAAAFASNAADPVRRVENVANSQDAVVAATDAFAKARAARVRTALRLAGVPANPHARGGMGGPFIAPDDPRALTADLGADPAFAARVQHAAADLAEARNLDAQARALPLAMPTRDASRSSGFGLRTDPITNRPAFHPGLDFAGGRMTPVYATAPGVVAFTGVRAGYGNTVEVDHGGGFKTRYAHLARIAVRSGQHVALGQRLGGMGSTGRSTGTHLHYEVWVNGRVQNPDRFVRAGAYVLQTG